jgi:hypothetical protein
MQIRISRTMTAAAVASLVAAMMFGYSRGVAAQQDPTTPPLTLEQALKELGRDPQVLSGEDFGFKINPKAQRSGAAQVGQLVVRINGQWVEAQFAPRVQMVPLR